MRIRLAHGNLPIKAIKRIENTHKAFYIGDFGIDDYITESIFYCPTPDLEKGHSHFFSIIKERAGLAGFTGNVIITKADRFLDRTWAYCYTKSSDVLHISCNTHHTVNTPYGFIDGGSYYVKTNISDQSIVGMTKIDFKAIGESLIYLSPDKRTYNGRHIYTGEFNAG